MEINCIDLVHIGILKVTFARACQENNFIYIHAAKHFYTTNLQET